MKKMKVMKKVKVMKAMKNYAFEDFRIATIIRMSSSHFSFNSVAFDLA